MKRHAISLTLCAAGALAITIATNNYTNERLAYNGQETTITPANVSRLQKAGKYTTDAAVYAQPLYIPALTVDGTPHNVLVILTMGNTGYLFDADQPGTGPLKTVSFGGNQPANSYPTNYGDLIYQQQLGCLGTPVADVASGKLWAVCSSATDWILYRLELSTLAILNSQTISGSVPGTGNGGSTVAFVPLQHTSRAGLTLTAGNVYVSFGSMADQGLWHGWIFSFDQTTLSQNAIFCTTCDTSAGGGIWQSGGGLSVDGSGNIYAITGNGGGTPVIGNLNESLIKFDSSLNVLDWYAPTTFADMNGQDEDLASGRPLLIPGTNLIAFGAKNYQIYSVNSTCLGNIGGTNNGCTAPQVFPTATVPASNHSGVYGLTFIPETHTGYFPNTDGNLYRFTISGTTWNTTPTLSPDTYGFPGAQMTSSSNGSSNQIVWASVAVTSALFSPATGRLYALDPVTMTQLWSSNTNAGRDAPGQVAKFNPPTIASGRVYLGTLDNGVQVYRVPDQATTTVSGQATISGKVKIE
jgi:hypothetical protein